jgi:RNA polymerase sigma-70 factor (ECF subfamily)
MMQQEDLFYIDKVLAGDHAAFEVLVNRHKDMIFTIVNRILRNREDAEEIAQDVFLKSYQSLSKFKRESKFSTWLYRIAYNTAISKTRKKQMEVSAIDDHIIESHTVEGIFENAEEFGYEDKKKYFDAALKKIPEEDSMLISMFYLKDQSIDDISEVTGLSASNVKVKLHRIRKKLFQTIEGMRKHRIGEFI